MAATRARLTTVVDARCRRRLWWASGNSATPSSLIFLLGDSWVMVTADPR